VKLKMFEAKAKLFLSAKQAIEKNCFCKDWVLVRLAQDPCYHQLTGLTTMRESLSAGTGLLSDHKLKTRVPNQNLKEPVSTEMLATENCQTQMLTGILKDPVRVRSACAEARSFCQGGAKNVKCFH
jgi:hypothetical protein